MPVRVNLFDNKLETEVVFDYDPVAISFFARKYISLYNLNALYPLILKRFIRCYETIFI